MLVATYNAHRGRSTAGIFRPARIARVIAETGADLVALQEAQHWLRPGRAMFDAAWLEREAGLRPLSVTDRAGEQGWRGNVLLVRPGARVLRPPIGLRIGGLEPRGAILAELDLGWGAFRVVATHLSLGAERRHHQAEALLQAVAQGPPMPTLVMGDLNEWRPGASALGVLEAVFGHQPPVHTFPAFRPMLALDRIMGLPHGLIAERRAHDTKLARGASDHLPLVARIDTGLLAWSF